MKHERNLDSGIFLPFLSLEEMGLLAQLLDVFLTCSFFAFRVFSFCMNTKYVEVSES